jgi:hypothetical protein
VSPRTLAQFLLDVGAAERHLDYRPRLTYPHAVRMTCAWLVEELKQREFSDTYLANFFDYSAEDTEILQRR